MFHLSPTLLLIAALSHTGWGASITPTPKPSVWSVSSNGQAQLLCLVPGTDGRGINIWFSNGNGTELGTFYSPGVSDHPSATEISKLQENVPPGPARLPISTHFASTPPHRNGSTHPLPSGSDWATSSFLSPPASLSLPPKYENLGAFALLSLPTEELKAWSSISCLVAQGGTGNVWHRKTFNIQGKEPVGLYLLSGCTRGHRECVAQENL
ncbi:hypothetical protein XENTR_v10024969 [Xenopus tropicalis]|nr:hypothetical protein XENTR_v10024969 [Xenopus tropicalis]